MEEGEYCSQCIHVEWDNKERYSSIDRYWCKARHKYVEPSETKCRYDFVLDPTKLTKKPHCYITTIVVNILGYEDNCELLNVLRNFRDKYLKVHFEYLPLLVQYDLVGPIISDRISTMNNNDEFSLILLKRYLVPCANLIKAEKYEEAITLYTSMVLYLSEILEIEQQPIVIDPTVVYNIETLGKGRIRQPKTSEI